VIAVLLLAALTTPIAAAGQPVSAAAKAYLQELDSYERGEREATVAALQGLNVWDVRQWITAAIAELDARIAALQTAAVGPAEVKRLRREQIRVLTLALVVHTDLVLRIRDPARLESQLWLCQRILADIRHLKAAEGDTGEQRSALLPLVRDWYVVVVSQMQYLGNHPYLRGHISAGLAMFPDDAELLLARGTVAETDADLAFVDRSLADAIYTRDFVRKGGDLLRAAVSDYQAALRVQPGLHEATLRLGRVTRLLGNRTRAQALYTNVAEGDAVTRLKFLARLFRGELAELEKDATRAEAEYRAAHALAPAAQSPMLAVSRLCDARGDSGCARDWLRRSFDAASPDRQDPWWGYLRGQAWLVNERFARLRTRGLGR